VPQRRREPTRERRLARARETVDRHDTTRPTRRRRQHPRGQRLDRCAARAIADRARGARCHGRAAIGDAHLVAIGLSMVHDITVTATGAGRFGRYIDCRDRI
jgi:hypothetical protein